mmetsp:Transcript_13999/g.20173  ORF Transcript_13999/g.20173 Transcript_13999/m.20173 type:complete len:244 (-) Transcript_13999:99-830(-)
MMMKSSPKSRRSLISTIGVIVLVALVILTMKSKSSKGETESSQRFNLSTSLTGGIAYYHCKPTDGKANHDIVMLHGARFTKEDWKSSGILDQLCSIKGFSVTALDLDKKAGAEDLQSVLLSMRQDGMVKNSVILITPSASGKTIADWILGGDFGGLKSIVKAWIPVAPPSVKNLGEDNLRPIESLPTLAIYGDEDDMGKEVSTKLGDFAKAQVVELKGRHPCYLDSPDRFVETVRDFIFDLDA